MAACGLDFGTSNTTLGLVTGQRPQLVPLEGRHVTIPSAIFFPPGQAPFVGRAAMAEYLEGTPGRLMRSLKSVLGSSLLEETTPVGRERIKFRDVIARYLAAVKTRAEAEAGRALDTVVHGRPVHFVDGDPEGDARAEDALREIATGIGFRHVSFQFEPIAAALDYEQQVRAEEIALIADIGGGTSDFSIVRLSPERHARPDRSGDILANDGVRIGGTDFDRRLSLGTVMPLLGLGSAMNAGRYRRPHGLFPRPRHLVEHQPALQCQDPARDRGGSPRRAASRPAGAALHRRRGRARAFAGDGGGRRQDRDLGSGPGPASPSTGSRRASRPRSTGRASWSRRTSSRAASPSGSDAALRRPA